jgi:EAL domain-containing protein (putative c-di-GMP-specific phosphodiesterase class I)
VPGQPMDMLLRHAELAVGEAKRRRRNWAWHEPVDEAARARQLGLLSSLRSAAAGGELELWLQPKQCLRTGRTLGMEGLVRWHHPLRGTVSPAEFIPFAERTGHIGVVTQAMIEAALVRLASWRAEAPQLSIAVNVSALDIRDPSFGERIEQLARRHRAPLDRLRLEITESSVMEDTERVLPVLRSLRDLGVQLSIDDFGTGYSSLAYLHRLPVSELKIDRTFVAGADHRPGARALLRTIVELGRSLDLCVTAEGVERAEELALLVELGCDVAQGYLIARPLDPGAATRYVAALAEAPATLA